MAVDHALFADGQPDDKLLARPGNLADMPHQYGVELPAGAMQLPVSHPGVEELRLFGSSRAPGDTVLAITDAVAGYLATLTQRGH
jgi:hypothetical protein